MPSHNQEYQSLLLVSFGGPEGPEEVIPFLKNVLRGKNVPESRMKEVAEHYYHFGGVSPINDQCRDLINALKADFAAHGIEMPIFWGNRNWNPLLPDTLRKMRDAGIRKSLAFFTSAFSCYSGCRQYRENIADAQKIVGEGAPIVDKTRMFFNHPLFVGACAARILEAIPNLSKTEFQRSVLLFTAHSIPVAMAEHCNYVRQLEESCRLVADQLNHPNWKLVFQSRSGPPHQPWLEPDVCDFLNTVAESEAKNVIVFPLGFLSDHMEVLFDLDTEAKEVCEKLGLNMFRPSAVGTHPKFIEMIRKLVLERTQGEPKIAIGNLPCSHDVCPENCCLSGRPNSR